MATKVIFYAFLLALVNGVTKANAVLTTATEFDDYLKVLKHTRRYSDQLRVAEAVWGQIQADFGNDLEKLTRLYHQLPEFSEVLFEATSLDSDEVELPPYPTRKALQEQAALELKEQIRRHLLKEHARLLANVLNGEPYMTGKISASYAQILLGSYETALARDIFFAAIDEVYLVKPIEVLAEELLQIYQPNDRVTFEFMLEVEMYIYWKFMHHGDISDKYLFNVAYYVHGFQDHDLYSRVDSNLRRRVERMIKSLPSSMQYLLFEPAFCLWNKGYKEYMYILNSAIYDTYRYGVFDYTYSSSLDSNFIWTRNITEDANGIKFSFRANNTGIYMYLDHDYVYSTHTNLIVAWRAGGAPYNSQWNVELHDNGLVFQQNRYIMCADTNSYDSYRRYIKGFSNSGNYTSLNPACHWEARKCPFWT